MAHDKIMASMIRLQGEHKWVEYKSADYWYMLEEGWQLSRVVYDAQGGNHA